MGKLAQIRQQYKDSLKSLDTEETLDLMFYRPIGYMWALLAAKLGITPNAITIASIFLGIAAGILFYFHDDLLWLNYIGMLLLVWANSFDSADGQLARLTHQYSRLGRILDGLSGDFWFVAIYFAICFRINETSEFFMPHPWLIWVMAVLAGMCHGKQAASADYYRQFHLYFLKGKEGSELDSCPQLDEKLRQLSWKKNFWAKFTLFFYRQYTANQEKLTPRMQQLRKILKDRFGDDIPQDTLHELVRDTLSFDIPLVPVTGCIHSLELFHGPTLAFKDVGARFMARLLGYFIRREGAGEVNVLVATSGDTGSAVANGFLGVEGIRVYVLYPKGKVSEIQEKQFTTLGRNITALEVDGTFDDCQALVKDAFMDGELNARLRLTSANSINVARFLPQSFYYFHAYAQLKREGRADNVVVCVPSGNFGNLTAGLFAARMGLPIGRFIAANNRNDIFYQYLRTSVYSPRPSIATIANAMDVGAPSNFARILDLYGNNHAAICADISGATYTDEQIADTVRTTWQQHHYLLDPHGACGFRALQEGLREGETGIFLETAHPAKFKDTVEHIIGQPVDIPDKLRAFMQGTRRSVPMSKDFPAFKDYLLRQ